MQENVFWGAGKLGKKMCELWASYGIRPDYVFDNNKELEGTYCNGIAISPKEKIKELVNPRIFITCSRTEEIAEQLQEYGYTNIVKCDNVRKMVRVLVLNEMIKPQNTLCSASIKHDILFDLENGMVLGGVESWTFESAAKLEKMGYNCEYISTDFQQSTVSCEKVDITEIPYVRLGWAAGLELCCREVLANVPCTVICNFAGLHFLAACMAKNVDREKVCLIAVQHSDDEAYYEAYTDMESYIDKCLVVSNRIRQKLSAKGFPEEKCRYLPWKVPCEEEKVRFYSEAGSPIRLGYAGRIVKFQKRADCLVEIAKKLRDKSIPFLLEAAGEGDAQEAMEEETIREGLQESVRFVGVIKRQEISLFWKRQDIMLSCSEVEGHSISQAEAMASGAVPVITNVSGAEDDVIDGQNGFIVEIGDIDGIVEKICYLHRNRDKLAQMGKEAHATINVRQKNFDYKRFWEDLLK